MARLREGRRQRRDAWAKRPDSHAPALPHGVGSTCERKPPQACGSITHNPPQCKPANQPMMQNGNATALAYRQFMSGACTRIQWECRRPNPPAQMFWWRDCLRQGLRTEPRRSRTHQQCLRWRCIGYRTPYIGLATMQHPCYRCDRCWVGLGTHVRDLVAALMW